MASYLCPFSSLMRLHKKHFKGGESMHKVGELKYSAPNVNICVLMINHWRGGPAPLFCFLYALSNETYCY